MAEFRTEELGHPPFRSKKKVAKGMKRATDRSNAILTALMAVAVLGNVSHLVGQGPPIQGTASLIKGAPVEVLLGPPKTMKVPILINLTNVTGRAPNGASTPVILGGYQIAVTFDKVLLSLETVEGDSPFNVVTTSGEAVANLTGQLVLTSSQLNASPAPLGQVQILNLTFVGLGPNTDTDTSSVSATPLNVSSALQVALPTLAGPTAIPCVGTTAPVSVGIPSGPSPSNGAIDVNPPVVLAWSSALAANTYQVYFGTSTNPPLVGIVSATSFATEVVPSTLYRWRIVAVRDNLSTNGDTWSFTTKAAPPPAFFPSSSVSEVRPPPEITILSSMCSGANQGATRLSSADLAMWLLGGGSATGRCDVPARLNCRVGSIDVQENTFFALGTTTVKFRFQGSDEVVQEATSTVTVKRTGDLDLNNSVSSTDMVILANYLVGNVQLGNATRAADLNQDENVNSVDIVLLANYLVQNVPCLPTGS